MNTALGDRMKQNYENRTRYFLPRRTYSILRVDGKAFHTLTKHMERPYDFSFIEIMDETAKYMCKNIQGAVCAYSQSDEISVLLTDFHKDKTCAWFDGNIQKIASIGASLATAQFNNLYKGDNLAHFDARVFTIPDPVEVENYFIFRQRDCSRNSIIMSAMSQYSHKELHNKDTSQMQDMLMERGVNWNDYPVRAKRGGLTIKKEYALENTLRSKWETTEPPIFSQDRKVLRELIPSMEKF